MSDLDPVPWDTIEAVVGHPAGEIPAYVREYEGDVRGDDPYVAVKTVHDAISRDLGADAAVSGQGEVYITTYLLEREGAISIDDAALPSLLDRRPDGQRLEELFWERERTMWWIAVERGVHWALVRYWLYEEGIPLRERNFSEETLAAIRDHR